MELKNIIEKLKKEKVSVYKLHNPQSGGCKFSLREVYKNKDGKEKVEYNNYQPNGLYMSKYYILKTELTGVYYSENKSYAICTNEDDYYGDTISIHCVEGYSLNREDVYNKFFNNNETSFIIEDIVSKTYYTANTFFSGNTIENVNEFINTMTKNGQNFKLIKQAKQWAKEK